jgi:DNA repair protein RadC
MPTLVPSADHDSALREGARQGPRERIRRFGPVALTDAELLAAVVGSGVRGVPASEVAIRLLARGGGSVRGLGKVPPQALQRIPGVGWATACRVAGALELGRRAVEEELPIRPRIRGPEDVHTLMSPALRDLNHEEFHALLLNAQHRVVGRVLVSRGILDASVVHPREVFKSAVIESAAAVVLVHNHPSGDPSPSAEDRMVTRQMRRAGETLGIPVLDHVVIGDGAWRSVEP